MSQITPVGCGYDYFAAPVSFTSRIKHSPILNVEDKLVTSKESKISFIVDTNEKISDFFTNLSIQESNDGQYRYFPACAAGGFKLMGYNSNDLDQKKYAFTHLVIVHRKTKYSFTGNVLDSLNPSFAQDLQGRTDSQGNVILMSPLELQKKYGTHVITNAFTGGLIELFIVTNRRSNESCYDVKNKIQKVFQELSVNTGNFPTFDDISSRSTLNTRCVGGEKFELSNFSDLLTNYAKWVGSLNTPEYEAFCGFSDEGFNSSCVPLSTLSVVQNRSSSLRNQFLEEYKLSNPIFGPSLQSSLSNSNFRENNNDMVTALTQYTINQTMKSFLKKQYQNEKTEPTKFAVYIFEAAVPKKNGRVKEMKQFYLFPDTDVEKNLPIGFPEELRFNGLYNELQLLGLEHINPNVKEQTEDELMILADAQNYYCLKCAIFIEFGFPTYYTQEDINNFKPIVLDAKHPGIVHFSQCFKEFRIIELKGNHEYLIFDQNKEKEAWICKYEIGLNIGAGGMVSKEPDKAVRQAILSHFKLIDPNTDLDNLGTSELNRLYSKVDEMYSISKLYLDFNALSLVPMNFVGTREFQIASQIIPTILKKNLKDKLILGRSFTENKRKDVQYAVIPLEYVFSVTVNSKTDDELNTLNYVINLGGDCNNNSLKPQTFNWCWIGEGRKLLQAGVSVINRDAIFDMVLTHFERNVLKSLCLQSRASIHGKTACDLDWNTSLTETSIPDEINFKYNRDGKNYVFGREFNPEWSWTSRDEQGTKTVYVPPFFAATCGLKLHYYMLAKAVWGNKTINGESFPIIIFDITVKTYTDVAWNGGHNEGVVYHRHLKCTLVLSIDELGNIQAIPSIEEEGCPTYFNRNAWSQFCSLSLIDGVSNNVTNICKRAVSNALSRFKTSFTNVFKLGAGWVLPGHGNFTFTHERFTESGDLAVDVNYYEKD